MQQNRKRRVRTCYPCYTRKQRCNREYPCNHCTRRRRPEECVFSSEPTRNPLHNALHPAKSLNEAQSQVQGAVPVDARLPKETHTLDEPDEHWSSQHSALAKSFGYFEDSNTNTMALLRKVGLPIHAHCYLLRGMHETDETSKLEFPGGDRMDLSDSSPTSTWEAIHYELSRMPDRRILDFLVQYFTCELNWMKQIVHVPRFLTYYHQWWEHSKPSLVADMEFATLILRICSYATQFLPSPTHTIDQIFGQPLSDIRNACSSIGDNLAKLCETLDWKGSLFRVQHILFAALQISCEGRTDQFWEGIASASRAAQKAGIHTDNTTFEENLALHNDTGKELDKETRRRTFCSLYVLDSHLSRQLDRVPFLPDHLIAGSLPRMHFVSDTGSTSSEIPAGAPDVFTERLMQMQLGHFWRQFGSRRNCNYDPTAGEQRYDKFCAEYVSILHAAFALDRPDMTWDNALSKLPMQRQLLHIAIFDSVCWNFRPLLLLKAEYVARLPPYKRVLLQSQKRRLGMAALKELEAVTSLHLMFGGSSTRFAAIIFNTFEAAVLLLCLCTDVDFPFGQLDENTDVLGIHAKLTYKKAMQASKQAIGRLQMLAELNDMAASGAQVAAQLFSKAAKRRQSSSSVPPADSIDTSSWQLAYTTNIGTYDDLSLCPSLEQTDPAFMSDIFSSVAQEVSSSNMPLSSFNFPTVWGDSSL